MSIEFFSFLAIRGQQGDNVYYLTHCPLRLVPRLFLFDEAEVPAELQQLHSIDVNRVESIAEYLLTNTKDYMLPPLIVTIDYEVSFESLSTELPEAGQLRVPLTAKMIIQDGQHRREAITRALKENFIIGDDTVPVMLIPDPYFSRAARLYSDLNRPKQRHTKSQRILHNHQNPLADLVRQLVDEVSLFKNLTELEKTTISNRSKALFTLSAVFQATQALLGVTKNDSISAEQANLAQQFWEKLAQIIPEWQAVISGKMKAADLRKNYIHAHGVGLVAIGRAGHSLVINEPDDWPDKLREFNEIDWSRSNKELWEGRAMVRGRMSKAKDSVKLTANAIKTSLSLPLTAQEKKLEEKLSGYSN